VASDLGWSRRMHITPTESPYEAGLGFCVRLGKGTSWAGTRWSASRPRVERKRSKGPFAVVNLCPLPGRED